MEWFSKTTFCDPTTNIFGGKALKNGKKLVKPTKSMKKFHKQECSGHVLRELVKIVTSMAQIHIL